MNGEHKHHPEHGVPGKSVEHPKEGVVKSEHKGHMGHSQMLLDFRNRFIVSSILTVPVLALTPEVQSLLGFTLSFQGDAYTLILLSSTAYLYGGYPFIKGFYEELKKRSLGMMTLVALAISVAYFYSVAATIGLGGHVFFWELVTLIDIMLLGHWVEMRSVLGASRALEELVKIMPSEAHLIR